MRDKSAIPREPGTGKLSQGQRDNPASFPNLNPEPYRLFFSAPAVLPDCSRQ